MSTYTHWTMKALLCLFLSVPLFAAGEQTIRIGIDRDNDPTTGCDFDPGTGDTRQGIDLVLEVVVNADVSPPMVFATRYQLCRGDDFGPFFDLGAGWPVGINLGIGGADVVEAALPVFLLGQTQTIGIAAGISDNRGSDDTNATLTFSSPVPTLGTYAFFTFIALLLGASLWVMRRNRQRGLLVLLGLTLVAATGSTFILDGQIDDWNGVGPLITDPQSDPGSTDATDIVGLFACLEGDDRLVFRLDVVDLENDPPIAMDDTFKTLEDVPATLDVLTNDSDPDLDEFEVVEVTSPSSGTAVIQADNTVLYTPNLNAKGTDSFTYTISDPVGLTDTAQVTIEIAADGDPPVAVDDTGETDEDTQGNLFSVLNNDFDPDTGDVLSISAVGTPSQGGTAVITGADIEYDPAPDFFGVETVTYTIQDLSGKSDSATLTITVNNVNDDPTATDDLFTVDEDTSNNAFDVLANDTDAPDVGETLTITGVGTPDNGGTATMVGGGTGIEYTPAADFFGTESFTYTLGDGNGGSDTATVTVTVTDVDDPVTAADDAFTAPEDGVTNSGDLLANDSIPDGGAAIQSFDANSSEGAVLTDMGDGSLNYDPSAVAAFQALDDGESAPDSFEYFAEDADGDTDMATVNVTVTGINDAPVANAIAETVDQNESIVLMLSAVDVDIENLTFSIVTNPTNGTLGAVTSTGPMTAEVTYTHNNLNVDPDSFTYLANDGTVDSAPVTVNLTINPNIAPMANDDGSLLNPIVIQRDSFEDIDVAANDTDSDGTLELASVVPTNGALGTTAATGGGIVRYTANPGAIGPDSFNYTIEDNDGATSNSAGVFVFINDPPVANDDMVALAEGTTTTISVLTNDTDSDGTVDPTTVVITTNVGPGEGTTMVNPDGSVAYDPSGYVGLTSFQYTVMDDLGGTSVPATVMINVSPAPTATDDNYFVYGHTTVSVPASLGILLNDTDDGLITANAGTFPTTNGGSITINSDGSFTYTTPGPGAMMPPSLGGTDSFTYTIQDKLMSSDTATITFTYEKVVWFTNNTNASGTEDGSQADPFNTLADAEAAASFGHSLFVFAGDGTTTGQDAGVLMQGSQELIGEIAGLAVDVDGMGPGMPIAILAPGARPVITNTTGDVVVLDDSNLITGLELQPQASAGILAGELKKERSEKPVSYTEQRQQERLPRDWFAVGGDTEISNLIVSVQNDFSDGLVFLGQTGNLTLTDITINGPMGTTGFGGLIFDTCLVNATITNLSVNEIFDSIVLAGNFGSSFAFDGVTVNTSDGLAFLAFAGGDISMTGTNTFANFFGPGFILDGVNLTPAGVNVATIDVTTCDAGIILDTVTGGPFSVTGNVTITDMVDNGIEIGDSDVDVTFSGLVNVSMIGDDGIELRSNTGSIDFQMPISVSMVDDDGLDIEDADATITFQDTVTITDALDAGIELNGNNMGTPMGSTSFLATVDIDNSGFSGLFVTDIQNNVSFATLDIDSAGIGGAIMDEASILGTFTVTQLDLNPGPGSLVGLGMDNSEGAVDINGGSLENVEGEVIGFLDSNMTFTFTGSVTQVNANVPLLLADDDDTSNVTFEAGTVLTDTAGEGLQFEDADGVYNFNTPVNIMGNNDDGIDISTSSTGVFNFNAPVTLNTGAGMAVRHAGGLGSELNLNGGLDIDTTTGVGFLVEGGEGMVSAIGTNTVDTTSGDPIRIIGMPIAPAGVTFQSVNSSAGGGIQIADTGSAGSFNITGVGSVDGSGGVLMGSAAPLQISATTAARYNINNLNLLEFTGIGVDIQSTMASSLLGTLNNLEITSSQVASIGVQLLGDGNNTSLLYNQRTSIMGCTINVESEGISARSVNSDNFGLVSFILANTEISSTNDSAVYCFVDQRSNLCMNANGNSPLISSLFDFELEQTGAGFITIQQDSVAALQAANDGGTATASTSGIIATGRVCPAP